MLRGAAPTFYFYFRETKLIIMSVMSTVRGLVHWGYFTPWMVTATTSCNYNHTLPVIWHIRLFINLPHWFAMINYNWIDYYHSNVPVWANWSDFVLVLEALIHHLFVFLLPACAFRLKGRKRKIKGGDASNVESAARGGLHKWHLLWKEQCSAPAS